LSKIAVSFLSLLVLLAFVQADGWHVSNYQLHMEEPSQKAVIAWDGRVETMLLSSAVKSDNLSNIAWIIPVQSYSKPEVTAGKSGVFEILDYFFARARPSTQMVVPSLGGTQAGVQVLETKEIGVYDIAVLKATDSMELLKWLQDNGYVVPPEAKGILDKYVAKGDYYFIANKIDLKNKYSAQLEEVDRIYAGKQLQYKRICDEVTQIFYDLGLNNSAYHFDYKNDANWSSRMDFCFLAQKSNIHKKTTDLFARVSNGSLARNAPELVDIDAGSEKTRGVEILGEYLNDLLLEEFKKEGVDQVIMVYLGDGLEIKLNQSVILDQIDHWASVYPSYVLAGQYSGYRSVSNKARVYKNGAMLHSFGVKGIDLNQVSSFNGFQPDANVLSSDELTHMDQWTSGLSGQDVEALEVFFSANGSAYDQFLEELGKHFRLAARLAPRVIGMNRSFGNGFNELRDYEHDLFGYRSLGEQLSKVLSASQSALGSFETRTALEKNYSGLYDTLVALQRGLGTPLKIEFQPRTPYYPLEISSLNSGKGAIEVYVLAGSPVTDKNNVLKLDQSKALTPTIKAELQNYVPVSQADYATRLTYDGELNGLTADAEFQNSFENREPVAYGQASGVAAGSETASPSQVPEPVFRPQTYRKPLGFFEGIWAWLSGLFKK